MGLDKVVASEGGDGQVGASVGGEEEGGVSGTVESGGKGW